MSFEGAPFIAIWETTRACALACVHCRAEALPRRDPNELTTDEGKRLLERIRAFGDPPPLVVLTGGDPLRRDDIEELVAHGTGLGLSVSLTPSGTAAVTAARLRALQNAGLARLAVSLDGATAETHDAFRRVRGSYRYTMRILDHARALGMPRQINTTVSRQTVDELPALAAQMPGRGVAMWALFFLIPVGRASADQALGAAEIERVLEWAADLVPRVSFGIKTTEAPHFHRVLARRGTPAVTARPAAVPGIGTTTARRRGIRRAGRAVTDGNGFVFVDHVGNVCPSGFLPLPVGNVRADDVVALYRDHPLFRALRDPRVLRGRCGRCEYRDSCGGSRARAFALAGSAFGEDPGCAWEPALAGSEPRAATPRPIAGGSDAAPPSPPCT